MSDVLDASKPHPYEKHAQAISAIAALTSTAASPFMTGYRIVGYTLAGASILLSVAVSWMRSSDLPQQQLKLLLTPLILISVSSLGLLGWSYTHPRPAPSQTIVQTPPASQAVPASITESHDTYQIKTTGSLSPVITGGNGPVYIGDSPESAKSKQAHKGSTK